MAEERPTRVVFERHKRGVQDPVRQAFSDMAQMARELRSMGLGIQADRLEAIVVELQPPSFGGILSSLRLPNAWVTPKYVWFLAKRILEGADIIRDLMDDAEITGSSETLERAQAWLELLGVRHEPKKQG